MTEMQPGQRPLETEIAVNWADMDALGHVNNTVFLRWFETARIAFFEVLGLADGMGKASVGPILARQEIDYRLPLTYPDRIRVDTAVTRVGTTSFTMGFRIFSLGHQAVAAEGSGVMVMVNYSTGQKAPVPESAKQAIAKLQGEETGQT